MIISIITVALIFVLFATVSMPERYDPKQQTALIKMPINNSDSMRRSFDSEQELPDKAIINWPDRGSVNR